MTVSVINDFVVSDEGAVIAQGFITDHSQTLGYLVKHSIKRICKARGIANYKIVPFHHNGDFGLAAIMHQAGNLAIN